MGRSLEAFMNKLQQDENLQKELREQLGDPAEGVSAEDFRKFAASKGYEFNVEEINKGELSNKQLDTVAGGRYVRISNIRINATPSLP